MRNFNTELHGAMSEMFKLKGESTEDVGEVISPVVVLERRVTDIVTGGLLDATSATIHTTNATADTRVLGLMMSIAKSAAATSSLFTITAFVQGKSTILARMRGITLVAMQDSVYIPMPGGGVLLDRNSIITATSDTSNTNIIVSGTLYLNVST